jgi:hypothetical protein
MADIEEFTKRGRGAQLKGQRGENEVVAILQPWWQQIEPDEKFVRTPKSGGWSIARVRGEFRAAGDVMTTSKIFPFCVEAKRREGWKLASFAQGRASPIWGWWRQAISAAIEQGTQPALFFRRNHGRWWMLIPRDYFATRCPDVKPDIWWPREPASNTTFKIPDYGGVVPSCFLADRFCEVVSPRHMTMEKFP